MDESCNFGNRCGMLTVPGGKFLPLYPLQSYIITARFYLIELIKANSGLKPGKLLG
jgi:hypothetical protein